METDEAQPNSSGRDFVLQKDWKYDTLSNRINNNNDNINDEKRQRWREGENWHL